MNEIPLDVFIEDKSHSTKTPLKCVVYGRMTLNEFKIFISREKRLPFNCQYLIIRGQLRKDSETFSSIGLMPMKKAESICIFLCKSSESIEFNHIIEVLDKPHLRGMTIKAWTCPACTFLNEPTRPGCLQCGANRPEDYVIPPNYTPTPAEQKRLQDIKRFEKEAEQRKREEEIEKRRMSESNFKAHIEADKNDPLYFVNQDAFECPVCMADIPAGEGITLRSCAHSHCKGCIVNYIANIDVGEIKCPVADCNYLMEDREIRGVSPPEVYKRFHIICDQLAQATCENKIHCKTPDCNGWAVTFNKENGTLDCAKCHAKTCIPCDVIHHPMTCKEYQDDLRIKAQNDKTKKEDLNRLENMVKNKEAIKCPTCKMIILKNGGCDGFQCLTCKTWLCWATKGPRWGPKGVGDTSGGCRCKVNGVKCHPKCGYCH